ncbi:MAG: hypothetical protein LBS58_03885 [Coriobacteriales bacterium]|nr:hypothetical protein [Coriobacteriales bacterium]
MTSIATFASTPAAGITAASIDPTHIAASERFPGGALRQVVLACAVPLATPLGALVPQYRDDPQRKRLTRSLTFYESGALRSIVLEDVTWIPTGVGTVPAELITFYESGALKRVLPSYGSLSGFWTEKNEYDFVAAAPYALPFGVFTLKAINIAFYEGGAFKSITLWPFERLEVPTSLGLLPIRVGFSCYENGAVASLEPLWPLEVATPVGTVVAFDPEAMGMDGESNSLGFWPSGAVRTVLTVASAVTVRRRGDGAVVAVFEPQPTLSHYHDKLTLEPLRIRFEEGFVRFGAREDSEEDPVFSAGSYSFEAVPFANEGFALGCLGC